MGKKVGYDKFTLKTDFTPMGDQPTAIKQLVDGFIRGNKKQTLLGVTGSGKTFTAAHVIQQLNLPTLIMAPNKTLAAQLYAEYKQLFPNHAVEYFVSFYDYYQPEAYLPTKDLYIDKDFNINEEIEKLRNSTTKSLSERRDVIVVASVSCIYNVGLPSIYQGKTIFLKKGLEIERDGFLRRLVDLQYTRNEMDLKPKTFRAKGDRVELLPIYQEQGIRVEFYGDEIEAISIFDPVTGNRIYSESEITIYPATQYLTETDTLEAALREIRSELAERRLELENQGNLVALERLVQRTNYDLEQLEQAGYCAGIENYSRFFDGRNPGDPPYTLLDYFPNDFLLILDESHQTIPQIHGMYGGDFSRKLNLVNYGFRLPSAYDNRPLRWEEFEKRMPRTLFMSATPGNYELSNSQLVAEQIIRPTGLVDPVIEVKQTENQIDDLMNEVEERIIANERVLVTTLTKRMAEDLSDYLSQAGFRSRYMHSEIDTLDRVQILKELRMGDIDILVGINLLREGLDLPEVSLVAILDADKEGFLRDARSLIQIMGRAARNVKGKVILYGDKITESMQKAISENNRRRKKQTRYNKKHGITPKTIVKGIFSVLETLKSTKGITDLELKDEMRVSEIEGLISDLTVLMEEAADNLEFELAAEFRDKIKELKQLLVIEKNS
ncbi:MAG: excinuclease ABC subunit UvrB [Candidatus Heimdallarchaeota archaeon]|nr:excinuclease ABC subunit UvrB [Candidatus Heimdallarchaeota archaeon]MDH5645401.1 excinuclease ABC subunit UvrB [Candidatus Heimdallarchaeota archaeon]